MEQISCDKAEINLAGENIIDSLLECLDRDVPEKGIPPTSDMAICHVSESHAKKGKPGYLIILSGALPFMDR